MVSYSGKHLICDLVSINNTARLNTILLIQQILDIICEYNTFSVIQKITHEIENSGYLIVYILEEAHINIRTVPDENFIAFDLYSWREFDDNENLECIYDFLIAAFEANSSRSNIHIINRSLL